MLSPLSLLLASSLKARRRADRKARCVDVAGLSRFFWHAVSGRPSASRARGVLASERVEKTARRPGHFLYSLVEGLLVGPRRPAVAADLAHVLQGRFTYLLLAGRVVLPPQLFYAPAHICNLDVRPTPVRLEKWSFSLHL